MGEKDDMFLVYPIWSSFSQILYASNFTKEYDNCLQKSDDADVIFLKNIYEPDLYKLAFQLI